ncbi:Ribose ABC transport system, permease protein RbsC [Devosia sp. H5989]|uniref:ABC transporter permease n=1 Tax=Paradevosia tibetensis TaxID=1447062 RepID=A0A5B9DRA2_9HYPH|nr:ABC transporter permease [Youhaiella tibetensis]AKR56426.1 Ribose ABC transport system, permease protein RbsC [Devosia sp. H5989]QEE21475.1 ABC transporter permease [Youhaiella tibetensis]
MTSVARDREPAVKTRRLRMSVFGPLLALLLLLILGSLLNGNFLTFANMANIVARASFIGIIAIGATFVITSGGLDLSVGSMAAFIAGMMIIIINSAVPSMGTGWSVIILGIAAGLAIGAAAGAANGLLVTAGRIEPFIVTLGSLGIFRALITFLANGGTLNLNFQAAETYSPLYSGSILGIPVPIIVFAAVAIVAEVVMRRTTFGRHLSAIGSNEQVARYSAIKVDRVRLMTYVLQGFLVGMAAALYVPKFGSANSSTAVLWELQAIAAVIIGGTMLRGGFGRVWGTVVGVIILELIGNILNLQSFISPYLNQAFQGAIIIVAVLLQRQRRTTN